jgi:hypothetical protein
MGGDFQTLAMDFQTPPVPQPELSAPAPRTEGREPARDPFRGRRESSQKPAPDAPKKLTGKALENHLREYQLNLIRKGDAPLLPVPVTPKMEKQLIKEGVLAPQDAATPAGNRTR